jgi:DNA-binding GntR family transcriptional regulator
LIAKSRGSAAAASPQDAAEIAELVRQLEAAVAGTAVEAIQDLNARLEDVLFYLEDA